MMLGALERNFKSFRSYVYESWKYSNKVYQEKVFGIEYEDKGKVLQLFILRSVSFIIYNLFTLGFN